MKRDVLTWADRNAPCRAKETRLMVMEDVETIGRWELSCLVCGKEESRSISEVVGAGGRRWCCVEGNYILKSLSVGMM